MERVFFKSDKSDKPMSIMTTVDGKISYRELGSEFGLVPDSIRLCGDRFPKNDDLLTKDSWTDMKNCLHVAGTKEDPVMVSGRPISEAPTGKRSADAAKLPKAEEHLQLFVQSAAQNYQKWEREREVGVKFLAVDRDPFYTFDGGFFIFIRKSYEGLKKIFMEAGRGKRHIVLGTAGIGKSLFTVFWICYLATLKKKVVWKFADGTYYLLDFSLEVVTAWGPLMDRTHPDLHSVLHDSSSWLIIDGKQRDSLQLPCRMLLACSMKKENYHEFSKHSMSDSYYLPVWEETEINEFCKDFEEHRSKFSGMHVPDMPTALENFKELGGVPRYVLDDRNTLEGKAKFWDAVRKVDTKNCLEILSGCFVKDVSDRLIHMFVDKEEDHMSVDKETDYKICKYGFASSSARDGIIKQFDEVGHVEVVGFLEKHIDSQMHGTTWGHLYEGVAHVILSRGGKFKRKRVFEDTADEATEDFKQEKLEFLPFEKVEDLSKFKDEYPSGAYCRASNLNFESVDAVIVPDTLVQYFRYCKGNHGYKIQGLKELDKALNMENYNVWSCVPKESFENTKFSELVE